MLPSYWVLQSTRKMLFLQLLSRIGRKLFNILFLKLLSAQLRWSMHTEERWESVRLYWNENLRIKRLPLLKSQPKWKHNALVMIFRSQQVVFRMTDDRVRFTDDQAAWSKASCVKRGYWKDEVCKTKSSFFITLNFNQGPHTMHTKRTTPFANHPCHVLYATQTGRYNTKKCDWIEKS